MGMYGENVARGVHRERRVQTVTPAEGRRSTDIEPVGVKPEGIGGGRSGSGARIRD